MRRDFPRLRDDMLLMIKVIKKLRAQDRWKRRYLGSGSASLFERVRIDPVKKREQYLQCMEQLGRDLDDLISSPDVSDKIKLRA